MLVKKSEIIPDDDCKKQVRHPVNIPGNLNDLEFTEILFIKILHLADLQMAQFIIFRPF
jgi:hypothetical protein